MVNITMDTEARGKVCPDCGVNILVHREFRNWCPECEWNLGSQENTSSGPIAKIYHRIGASQGDKIFKSVIQRDPEALRPNWSVSRILAFMIALCVHGFFIAVTAVSLYALNFDWPAFPMIILGVILLIFAWCIRPRLGRMPKDCLRRDDAPELYALCDRVADKVGSPRPDGILITSDYNAAFARVGLTRKTLLVIGLPMWMVQSWPERLATLGHEFSHGANGDATRGVFVGTALNTLDEIISILRPVYEEGSGLAQMLAHYSMWTLSWIVELVYNALAHLMRRESQKAEFLADYLATTVSGSEAMKVDLMKIPYGVHLGVFARKTIFKHDQESKDLLKKFVSYFQGLPASELDRLDRISDRENAQLDATHPPTRQRIAFIDAHPIKEPSIVIDEEQKRRIRDELAKSEETVGQQLIKEWSPDEW